MSKTAIEKRKILLAQLSEDLFIPEKDFYSKKNVNISPTFFEENIHLESNIGISFTLKEYEERFQISLGASNVYYINIVQGNRGGDLKIRYAKKFNFIERERFNDFYVYFTVEYWFKPIIFYYSIEDFISALPEGQKFWLLRRLHLFEYV